MKKLFSIVICVMALALAGCEEFAPATSNKVITGAAENVTTNSVVLHGEVNVDISQYDDVEFGMMVSESLEDLNNRDGDMYKAKVLLGKEFKIELKTLSPATDYYYCAWLFLNDTQYEFGSIRDFETEELPGNPNDPNNPANPANPDAPNNPSSKYVAKPFSVSSTKQVYFSPGNLQYTQSTNTWSFASAQWEMLGTDNVTGGSVSTSATYGDSKTGTALADKVDLFGWSTSATNFGVNTSTSDSDYSGSFIDWGTNKIGGDTPNTWRTLTYDEWDYLRYNRNNASSLRGVAQVNGVNGLIFLPDNWTCPAGVTFKSGFHSKMGVDYYAAYQIFTADQWSKLEESGAIFLPASGYRWGTDVDIVQYEGSYWSATEFNGYGAYYLFFYSNGADMRSGSRLIGLSVRLVKDL